MSETENEIIIKPKKGRPIKSPDGIPNNKPLDPNYFNSYYHNNLAVKIPCLICGETVSKSKMQGHLKTKKCIDGITAGKSRCNICNKIIIETRNKQHMKSKYCLSFLII